MALLKYSISFGLSIDKYKSLAMTSIPNLSLTSVEVVMTGVAPISFEILFVKSFAPPRWPESVDITKLALSSMFTIAGSVSLDLTKGAIDLISIPEAMIATMASYS